MIPKTSPLIPALLLAVGLAGPALAQTAAAPAADPAAGAQSQEAGTAAAGAAVPSTASSDTGTDSGAADPATDSASRPEDAAAVSSDAGPGAESPAIDPAAPAGEYVFDQSHSQIVFSYDHMGMSTSHGVIRGVAGTITLDPADPANSKVEALFPLSSIQTIAPELDEHLGTEDFFAGAAPATAITFTSTSVEQTGPTTARVTGDLLLNDVTRPVTLDVTLRKLGAHPMTGQPAAGFDITGTINRSDFNLGAFAPAVGDEVDLQISVEAAKG
ncbi:YceI family protein [uncultured Paracoccus sp.]|uniref:YceI family protein n=1 Tax=uncultured Paracoccus sp. TaxID=189685 RepID=UPI00262F3970|nr:YceI family protein [uncultured Paracoccus sp.]